MICGAVPLVVPCHRVVTSDRDLADRVWEGARGLEWTLPSPPPHHTFTTPPVIKDGDLAHGDITH